MRGTHPTHPGASPPETAPGGCAAVRRGRALGTGITADDGPCCPEEKWCGGWCCGDHAPVCVDPKHRHCCTAERACGTTCCAGGWGVCCPSNAFHANPYCCPDGSSFDRLARTLSARRAFVGAALKAQVAKLDRLVYRPFKRLPLPSKYRAA